MNATHGNQNEDLFDAEREPRFYALLRETQAQIQAGRLDQAIVNLWRCALATDYADDDVLKAMVQIYQEVEDIANIQEIWKRSAVSALERGDLNAFLERTYRSIYSESFYSRRPNYDFADIDPEIQSFVRIAAHLHPIFGWVDQNRKRQIDLSSKLRVGFVLEGFSQTQAPTRNYIPLAQYHNPDEFELYFYSRIGLNEPIGQKERYAVSAAYFESYGAQVWAPERPLSFLDQAGALAQQIVRDEIDILVYQTTYFQPVYNLLSWLRPAPFQVQLEHQQPEHSRAMDLIFTTGKAGLEAATTVAPFPISCVKNVPAQVSRHSLGLPQEGLIMVSANRAQRYAQEAFWTEMIALLDRYPNTYFAAVGLTDAAPHVGDRTDLLSRIITPGHRDDVMAFYAVSDVYVDLFPSGGGSSVIESVTAGTPVVTFDQDLTTPYSVNAETLAEYVGEDALAAPSGDIEAWRGIMARLIEDDVFRNDMRAKMKEQAINFRPDIVAARFFSTIKETFLVALKAAA